MPIDCPIPDGEEPDSYVKKGVAMLTTLDDEWEELFGNWKMELNFKIFNIIDITVKKIK